jgi:SOS-response transcriptional repressor LexA
MEPQYRDGDIVVVDTAQPVRAGVCCILLDAGGGEREAVVKRLSLKGDQATLASLNRCYPPRTLPAAGIVAAYRIIAHLPRST